MVARYENPESLSPEASSKGPTNLDDAFVHLPTFNTGRLRIRPMEERDAEAIFTFKADLKVTESHGQEPPSGIGNAGRLLGEDTPTNCLQGRKSWRTGDTRPAHWDIAGMLRMWKCGGEGAVGEDSFMSSLRA